MPNKLVLLLVLISSMVLLGEQLALGSRNAWPFNWPGSIADSKRNGAFKYMIKVTPEDFVWQDHEVQVYECWMEKPSFRSIFFKLKIDGKSTLESQLYKKHGVQFEFERIGAIANTLPATYGITKYESKPTDRAKHLHFGLSDTVHNVRLDELEKVLNLRLVSRSRYKRGTKIPTDIILNFQIPGEAEGAH